MSHLGRPKGKVESSLSLYPCAKKLQDLMNIPVLFTKQQGTKLEKEVANLKPGTILLLENLRFSSEESTPNPPYSLAQSLANLGDCYINDAFGSSHRKHSSTFYLPKLFPEQAGLGFLIHKEIQALAIDIIGKIGTSNSFSFGSRNAFQFLGDCLTYFSL